MIINEMSKILNDPSFNEAIKPIHDKMSLINKLEDDNKEYNLKYTESTPENKEYVECLLEESKIDNFMKKACTVQSSDQEKKACNNLDKNLKSTKEKCNYIKIKRDKTIDSKYGSLKIPDNYVINGVKL